MTEDKTVRIGIFGGTFSPPHIGHINAAIAFSSALKLDELMIIPTNIPPHKSTFGYATSEERLEMCRLAFEDVKNATVSDMEITREGKSYTAKTVEILKKTGQELFLLVGTDMFTTLDSWYMPEYIFANATIVYIRRETDENTSRLIEEKLAKYEREYHANIVFLETKVTEISSTELRAMIARGERDYNKISRSVMDYIEKKGLYRD